MNPEILKSQSNLTPICKVIKDCQIYKDYENPFRSLGSTIVLSGSFSDRPGLIRSGTNVERLSTGKLNCIQKALVLQNIGKEKDLKKNLDLEFERKQFPVNKNLRVSEQKFSLSSSYGHSKFVNFEYVEELRRRNRIHTLKH